MCVCVCVCVCVCARARTTILAPLAVAGPPPKGQRKKRRSSLHANASQIKHVVKHKKKRALPPKNACTHIPSPQRQYWGPPTNCWLTDHCSSCGSLASPNPNPQTLFDPARSRPGPVRHHFSIKKPTLCEHTFVCDVTRPNGRFQPPLPHSGRRSDFGGRRPFGGPNHSTTQHDAATTQLTTQLKTATTQHDAATTQLTTQLKLLAQTNQTAQLPLVPPKLKLFRIDQNLVSQHAFASNLPESGRKIRKVRNRPTYTFSPAPTYYPPQHTHQCR